MSGLLHIDETSWRELNTLLWLWVFCGQGVVVYWVGLPAVDQNYWQRIRRRFSRLAYE